jgi:hypothetical protein
MREDTIIALASGFVIGGYAVGMAVGAASVALRGTR